ncbi:unnamed protein product [Rotaria sordida]|uniref:AB hydrolase-1 domain-containing protein n=1 Tax=Rotaria sordida TaxID=392033 RepID=A0A815DLD3_9BILA|nr:unnamed protein product [Rotaria sordida]CAF1303102.1 unnamed protein product [Rotaria sordida]CAF3792995.1 unnamed protein product [Rotaria sordida]CAF3868121.1 unnamed protein product [Rotaria sordida]
MLFRFSRIFQRMMSTDPTSRFITLSNRPIVDTNGKTVQGPLKLHYWEWQGHQPTILFCHAASFHGRCYDPIINEALHGFHVIALDFRGHGRSQTHPPPYRFRWHGEDVLQFIETLNLNKDNLIGIGHSMGGYALTCAAAIAPRRLFQALLLLDPVIFPSSLYQDDKSYSSNLDYILRRKNQWLSVEDMFEKLEKREPFSRWPKETLRNYCTYALDKNYKLVCAPDGEASIYRTSIETDTNIYPFIKKSKFIQDIPIHIVRASFPYSIGQFDTSPTAPDLVKWFQKGQDTQLENTKHFFPMEQPQLVIDLVKKLMEENKKLFSHL